MDKSIENLLENIKGIKNIDIRRIIDDFENLIKENETKFINAKKTLEEKISQIQYKINNLN